ncbi:MAG: hypothetical protein AAF693_12860 [Bacteroidota bacterium]
MNIYQMYYANNKKFGFWVERDSWERIIAKVTGIEGVQEGQPIPGKQPYHDHVPVQCEIYDLDGEYKNKQTLSGPGTFAYSMIKVSQEL